MQELTDEPHLFVGGASRLDIQQGQLGQHLFLCSIKDLSVISGHTWFAKNSCGVPQSTKSILSEHKSYQHESHFSNWHHIGSVHF